MSSAVPGTRFGYPVRQNVMRGILLAALLPLFCSVAEPLDAAELAAPPGGDAPPLTRAQQILELGLETARQAFLPVQLQGLVTYADPAAHLLYVQDLSAGIRVVYTNADLEPVSGQIVLVHGLAMAGTFAPYVDCSQVKVIGSASIPEPCEAPAARMAAGELFGQWVQIEGVVRDFAREPERAVLFVSSGGLRFHAVIQPFPGSGLPLEWLEARVTLRGVCWTEVDSENKPVGFTLYVPGTNNVFSLSGGQRDPFRQPALPLTLHPELRRQSDLRVKISGVVTFHSPSGYVYLEEQGGVARARLLVPLPRNNPQARYPGRPRAVHLLPGDRIDLVGAPTASVFAPALQDAEFRKIGAEPPPVPSSVSIGEAMSGKFDARLIALKARLLAAEIRQTGALKQQVLALQAEDTIFEMIWEFSGTNALFVPAKNSYLGITGICLVQPGELNQVRAFRLLLRDRSDLQLLGRPPWWEPLPVGRILTITCALVAGGLIWIGLLRRQVAQRTSQLQAEVREKQKAQSELRHALVAERELGELRKRFVSMVSHEFRTPLGVILSAAENLNTYDDRLQPEQRRKQLQHVIGSTRHMAEVMENVLFIGRAEAGKVKCNPVPMDLAGFCQGLADEIGFSSGQRCLIRVSASSLPMARADEALLRQIMTNLLTNAIKYSRQGEPIEWRIEQRNGQALFRVRDFGIGIPAADQKQLYTTFHRGKNVGQVPGTGLGLVIVKRCVEIHGGELSFESTEGRGTIFTVTLPLFANRSSLASQ